MLILPLKGWCTGLWEPIRRDIARHADILCDVYSPEVLQFRCDSDGEIEEWIMNFKTGYMRRMLRKKRSTLTQNRILFAVARSELHTEIRARNDSERE